MNLLTDNTTSYYEEKFTGLSYTGKKIQGKEFENCVFEKCKPNDGYHDALGVIIGK